ncbi:MAG: hypothetical protein ABI140_11635 [Jatrophihabitantaceae bacterium]
MPSVKVCLWNIQNYGQPSGKYNGRLGNANELRNRFLSRFLQSNAIDVLMIQEVMPNAQAALTDLVARLNALYPVGQRDWRYSWCGCAIRDDTIATVTQPANLIDRTGARSECFGVVWRSGQAARFTMIRGAYQIAHGSSPATLSPLNISQLGRPTGNVTDNLGVETYGATGGFTRDNVYPWELDPLNDDYDLLNAWPRLNYPRTSNLDARRPSWSRSRRPAYVVIRLNDADSTLCPIAAYHAPSNQQLASWGVYMSGLAREVYATDAVAGVVPNPAIAPVLANAGFFGGDFNYSENNWPGPYRYFTDPRSQNYDSGANLTAVPPHTDPAPDRRTTVQIVTGAGHNVPIVSANTDDYLRYKIDVGFHRNIADITATRVDLLTEIMANPNNVYDNALIQTETYMAYIEDQVENPFNPTRERMTATGPQYEKKQKPRRGPVYYSWVPIICGAWGGTFTDWDESRDQFANADITDARRAGEYIHIFISDHLPLVATIDV